MYWVCLPGGTIPFRGRDAPWRASGVYPDAPTATSLPGRTDGVGILLGEHALGEIETLVHLGQMRFDAAELILKSVELDSRLLAAQSRVAVLEIRLPPDPLGHGLAHGRLHDDAEDHDDADHHDERRDEGHNVVRPERIPVERDLGEARRRSLDHVPSSTRSVIACFTVATAIRTFLP